VLPIAEQEENCPQRAQGNEISPITSESKNQEDQKNPKETKKSQARFGLYLGGFLKWKPQ